MPDWPVTDPHRVATADAPTPALELFQAITAHQISSAIHVAARLKLADQLGDQSRAAADLAAATGTHATAMHRLLRALASAGVVDESEPGRFALTAAGRHLRSDVPDSLYAMAMTLASPHGQERYHQLEESVRTGRSQVEEKGSAVFTEAPPAVIAMLNQAMSFFATYTADAIMAAADLGRFHRLVDVGGGTGMLLTEILHRYEEIDGVLFDQEHMVEPATRHVAEQGLASRCTIVGGDFFTAVPSGGDAYLLKHILHDWNDDRCVEILEHCHRAMSTGASLFIIETVLPETFDASPATQLAARSDLMMLLNSPSGRERSEAEFRDLLTRSGYQMKAVSDIRPAWTGVRSTTVIEAIST